MNQAARAPLPHCASLLSLFAFTALLVFAPARAEAREIEFSPGVFITVDGDVEDSRLSDGSLLLKWKSGIGSLQLPGFAKIWALLVGGGGGGGSGSNSNATGTGAGGGAGGYVERKGLLLAQGNYAIAVGDGGAPGADKQAGTDGGNSSITNVATNLEIIPTAIGGGGGSYGAVGRPGGSGGGGSKANGGAGTEGQGYAGGKGGHNRAAGGGGGAGDTGKGTTALNQAGSGGDGLPSEITGEEVWYAGGGGGSIRGEDGYAAEKIRGYGGEGGGGDGAFGAEFEAEPGDTNTGGGGGGGNNVNAGAAGGSGVVIVRITWASAGGVEKPVDGLSFTYTGEAITCFESVPDLYTISGTACATNVASYTFTATLKPGMHWGDDESDTTPVTCSWSITPLDVEPPVKTAESFTYDGTEKIGWTTNEKYYTFTTDGNNVNVATNAGTYTPTVILIDKANTRWSDTGATEDRALEWSITPLEVAPPAKTDESFTYNGGEQRGYEEGARYTLSSDNIATNVGTYTVTAALVDKENTVWSDTKTTDDKTLTWTIKSLEVAPPGKRADSFTYNGTEQMGFTTSARYEFTTDWPNINVATNAGTYTPKAILVDKQNTIWSDTKNIADKSLEWTIARKPVAQPELIKVPEGVVVYDGKAHVVMTNALAWTFGGRCQTNETNVGTYQFTLTPTENYCWVGGGTETVVYNWEIVKCPVQEPKVTEKFCYDKEGHWPIDEALGQRFSLGDDVCKTNVGSYTVKASLDDPENYIWSPAGTSDDRDYSWAITQRVNRIVGLSIDGWQVGKTVSTPHCTVDGYCAVYEPLFTWSTNRFAAATEWQNWATPPNEAGTYYLRASISATANWSSATAYASFTLYNHPSECLEDYVDITLSGYSQTSEVLTNYPALIRLSESTAATDGGAAANGFDYTRAGADGLDLCFTFAINEREDQILPYEVDTWNTNGESLVWVMIPELRPGPDFTTIRLYWAKKPGMAVPVVHPEQVWTNFYGVYHMNQISPDNKTQIADSTGRSSPASTSSGVSIDFEQGGVMGTRAKSASNVSANNPIMGTAAEVRRYYYTGSGALTPETQNVSLLGSFPILQSSSGSTVKWYDEARLIATATPGYTTWKNEEQKTFDPSYAVRGIVHCAGVQQDYWTTLPSLTTNQWDEGTDTSSTFHYGALKSGGEIVLTYRILPRGTITNELPTTMGEYVAIFDRAPTPDWALAGGPVEIPFTILAHAPYPVIDSDYSASGRILLANRDCKNSGSGTSPEVEGQGWFDSPDTYNRYTSLPTYWTFPSTLSVTMFNLHKATEAILWRNDESHKCLWHLQDCRQGNLFPTDDGATLPANQNFLPWSPTSLRANNHNSTPATRSQVGCILMRNVVGAAVTSGCFTNGIGTIYFDTVNFRTDRDDDVHKFVIEYVTQQDVDFDLTDDANFKSGEGETFVYTKLEGKWHTATMVPMICENGAALRDLAATTEFGPGIKTGGAINNFYRIRATLNTREPIRFRIRRTTIGTGTADGGGLQPAPFIILDNILVSKPPQEARLVSAGGDIDLARTGKTVLGSPCAFSQPFPSITDRGVYGRAKLEWLDPPRSADTVASATMRYRWRYLNQAVDSSWRSVKLDPNDGLRTVSPLVYSQLEGDIEYYFTATVRASYFEYCATNDYSGAGLAKSVGDFTEEIGTITTRLESPTTLASGGTDWFVRLRNGKSDWEGVDVEVTEGDLKGRYPMWLVDDNQWRALVPVKQDQNGEIRFRFRGENLQVPGEPYATGVDRVWSPNEKNGSTAMSLPDSGRLRESSEGSTIVLDHAAGYIEFKMSDKFMTYAVARAEMQDFNDWNDAHRPAGDYRFSVNLNETNGVDVVKMERYDVSEVLENWQVFPNTNGNWNETFYLADAHDPRYPRDIVFIEHDTPNRWKANNISFVGAKLTADEANSGCAGKILGQGNGKIEFLTATHDAPEGLESVQFCARIGQAADFDSIGFSQATFREREHMIFTPLTMSQACHEDGSMLDDMAVGASVSLIECYQPNVGCYEFRVSRPVSGKKRTLTLYKWFFSGGAETNVVLCKREFTDGIAWTQDGDKPRQVDRRYYGALLSFKAEQVGGKIRTRLVCGITHDATTLGQDERTPADNYDGFGYDGFLFDDESAPLTSGSYGLMSKDCPAQFMMPIGFPAALDVDRKDNEMTNVNWTAVSKSATVPYAYKYIQWDKGKRKSSQNALPIPGADDQTCFVDEREFILEDMEDMEIGWSPRNWSLPDMRLERVDRTDVSFYHSWVGFRTPTNLEQTAILQVRPKGNSNENAWSNVLERTVASYSLEKNRIQVPLRLTGQWDIRLTTGPDAVDVVFDDIEQKRWSLPDDSSLGTARDIFTYTQSRVDEVVKFLPDGKTTTNFVQFAFEPARADPETAVSLRSPVLSGLGHFSFSYDEADADAEIWLQIETNTANVTTLAMSYNHSIESVDAGKPAAEGQWTTMYKYGPKSRGCDEELGTSGTKSIYLGWHAPIGGVIRLFVPPHVVEAAVAEAHRKPMKADNSDTHYGRVVIRGASVTDEPALSERAWRGWNIRTLGDATDSERRMYLADSTRADGGDGTGLSGALNNTTDADSLYSSEPWPKEELPLIAASGYPAIYSPTFGVAGGEQRGVGEVTFKARLYATTGSVESRLKGRVVLYGAHNSLGTDWTVIQTNEIVSTVFSNFTWSANGEVYSAIKFELTSDTYVGRTPDVGRIILDEIVVSEKIQPAIGFVYARPFRQNLMSSDPIADILSSAEQPLAGESWGIQTQVSVQQLEDEIDLTKGFRVFFSYFPGKKPWGFEQWKSRSDAVVDEELEQVGEKTNLVFRSTFARSRTLVEPSASGGSVVQFMLKVKYYDKKGDQREYTAPLTSAMWRQPDWYWPVDLNKENGGDADATKFAGYTILDTVSPGRAWINEVNWNDGVKDETGGELSTTNQFIEICIPSGVDMKGWYVQMTAYSRDADTERRKTGKIFTFGLWPGDPSSKTSAASTNGYEFFVIQSPATERRGDGGIKGVDGKNAADATWSDASQANLTQGTLSYYQPYQFELFRPSGVLEHQFVLQGTNTATRSSTFTQYEGTNLVEVLNGEDLAYRGAVSPLRFFAGHETSKKKDGTQYASAGVVGGSADGNPGPGAAGTWATGLRFTPGSLNEGQIIPEGWFLPPNGTNSWIYLSVEGAHLYQQVGTNRTNSMLIVMPETGSTNVIYTADAFYELDCLTVDGVTNATPRHVPCASTPFVYTIDRPKGTVRIVAHAGMDNRVLERINLKKYGDYAPSVVNWLSQNWPGRDADEIVLADYQCATDDSATKHELDLLDMYWLNIPPFTNSGEKEWTLRAGVTGFTPLSAKWMRGAWYTNLSVKVQMYKQHDNPETGVRNKFAVDCLQGLDSAKSSEISPALWRSETFKVRGALDLKGPFLPFRTFVFNAGSFDDNYESTIEIIDPFSTASPGYSYGWDLHPDKRSSNFWGISVDTDTQPVSIEMLKADDTY